MSAPEQEESMPFPGGRLQRPARARSSAVLQFRQVLSRHLVTMSLVAVVMGLWVARVDDWKRLLSPLIAHPVHYLAMCVAIVAGIAIYQRVRGIPWSAAQVGWVGYLFLISVVEEWAFRVFLPLYLVDDLGARASIVLSSVIFGCSPLLHAPLAVDGLFADHAGRAWIQPVARRIRRFGVSDPRALDRYVFEYAPPTCWRI